MNRIRFLLALSILACASTALATYYPLGIDKPSEGYKIHPANCEALLGLSKPNTHMDATYIKTGCGLGGDAQLKFMRDELAKNHVLIGIADGAAQRVNCREVLGISGDVDHHDADLINAVCAIAQNHNPTEAELNLARDRVRDVLRANVKARLALNEFQAAFDNDDGDDWNNKPNSQLITRTSHNISMTIMGVISTLLALVGLFLAYRLYRSGQEKLHLLQDIAVLKSGQKWMQEPLPPT